MRITKGQHRAALAALGALAAGAAFPIGAEATAPDSGLYTTYRVATNLQSTSWQVCGSTSGSDGCYASGSLGPFGRIGAMLEGSALTSGDTVTRRIFVLDLESGKTANEVTLFVYTKKDTVADGDDTVIVTLDQTIALPLVGGKKVSASMAANNAYLFAGTDQSYQAVSVDKGLWTVTGLGGFDPPVPVAEITADSYGFVTVTFGAPGAEFSGFYTFGPTGAGQEDGGGPSFMLDNRNAVRPAPLPD
jgi:hypothetical protein